MAWSQETPSRVPWGVSREVSSECRGACRREQLHEGTGRRVLEQAQVRAQWVQGVPLGLFGISALLFGLFCLFGAIHTPSYTSAAHPTKEAHPGVIHVLLTDIMMPGITGKQLADRLAAVRTDTKIIFMSGRASEVVSSVGVLIPVDVFLAKPFTAERLLNKVRERIEYCSPFSHPRSPSP
jgi:CheY-like chemotaxis protein